MYNNKNINKKNMSNVYNSCVHTVVHVIKLSLGTYFVYRYYGCNLSLLYYMIYKTSKKSRKRKGVALTQHSL